MKKNLPLPVVIITILVVIGVVYGIITVATRKPGDNVTITPEMREQMLHNPGAPGGPPAKPK